MTVNEVEGMVCAEVVVVVYFKELSHYFPGGIV
jgi:hypothetical protein